MSTFTIALGSNPAMLLQLARLAGVGVDRATAFDILERIDALEFVPLPLDVLHETFVCISGLDEPSGYDIWIDQPHPDTSFYWVRSADGDRLASSAELGYDDDCDYDDRDEPDYHNYGDDHWTNDPAQAASYYYEFDHREQDEF
jgi:hypothetical protein